MININNDQLLQDLLSEEFQTRWFAAEVLGTKRNLSSKQIETIIELAESSDVGEVLVWGLGMMRAKHVEPLIGKFLEHKDNYSRWRAAEALRDLGTPEAISILTDRLKNSTEAETRWKCAWALGEIGKIDSFENLWYSAEHDSDKYVRWKSIWGITCLQGDVERLVKAKFENSNLSDFMAWRLAWVLGRIGNQETVAWLKSMKSNYLGSKYVLYQIFLAINTIEDRY